MQKNLISAIAGWKSAALLALVAMVAAVAFSGVLSTTQTADAATVQLPAADPSGSAAPGDTVQIVVLGALAQLSITGTGEGVSASFSNGQQAINCGDNASCDTDDSDTTTAGRQNVEDSVRVNLKIDDDSAEGYILVRVEGIGAGANTASVTKVINVSKATLVGSLKITATPKTIAANNGTSTLVINVQNAAGTPAGLNGQSVGLVTTLGTIECVSGTEVQACSVDTAGSSGITGVDDGTAGYATVTLNGRGVEGTATITATLGTRTATATVTLFGTAKNLTAEPMQGSVEIGGDVYVVLTVTDGAGNPVRGLVIAPVTAKEVVGPEGVEDPVLLKTEQATAEVAGESAVGVGYSKDLIRPAAQGGNIPACGDDNTGSLASPETEVFDTDGTNDKGQCVVRITAPEADPTDPTTKDATRGAHTLNFQVSATVKASATIEVAGKPDSITTDAPARVEAGSVTTITVSVWDDTGVLVGITSVKTRKVDGGGLIEDEGEGGSEMTNDGQSKFTFIAPTNPGSSEILISAGTINLRVPIAIGPEEVVEEEVVIPDLAAPTSVTLVLNDDGTLSVTTSPEAAEGDTTEGDTTEAQVRSNGAWVDISEEAAAPGEYQARARFVRGDESTDWVYSSNVVEVPEPEVIPPVAPDAPDTVTLIATDDGLAIVSFPDVPEDATEEQQLRAGMGEWMAASEVTAEPSTTYLARVRFTRGEGAESAWVYSNPVVTAAAPEPEPEPEPMTWNNELVSGQNLVVWNGPDGADASEGAAEGVTAIWSYNTGSGTWDGYFPSAADVPGGNTLMSLSNGQAYVVIVE